MYPVDASAPFDFAGTNANGTAKPYNFATLSDGSHSISIKVTLTDGSIETTMATFTVDNSLPPPLAPARTPSSSLRRS